MTCCGTANATVANAAAATIAVIANVILLWFIVHDYEMEWYLSNSTEHSLEILKNKRIY
jgi:hypothetical protein